MAVNMATALTMERYGLLSAGRKVLDFGSSNLYTAPANEIADFVRRHNSSARPDLEDWAGRLAAGSLSDASGQALNRSFFGEMLEEAGMSYDSIDIAAGYKTAVLDLNVTRLPEKMKSAYDTVLNCGTSEHILNQMNVFAAIHAATKPGGQMFHSVPGAGHLDHGYFCYTGRFFFDLAGYNNYDLVDMWYDEAEAAENIFASARQYKAHFPALKKRLGMIGQQKRETDLDRTRVPVISINVLYRKRTGAPFMGTVDTSTSVGSVAADVLKNYSA